MLSGEGVAPLRFGTAKDDSIKGLNDFRYDDLESCSATCSSAICSGA